MTRLEGLKFSIFSHVNTRRVHVNEAKFMCTTIVRTCADFELGADGLTRVELTWACVNINLAGDSTGVRNQPGVR